MPAEFHEQIQGLRLPGDLWAHVMDSDKPGELAEYLLKNQTVTQGLFNMPLASAYRELGRIEGRLTGQQAAPNKKPASQVPDLDPVGKGNRPNGRDPFSKDASDEDFITAMFGKPG